MFQMILVFTIIAFCLLMEFLNVGDKKFDKEKSKIAEMVLLFSITGYLL